MSDPFRMQDKGIDHRHDCRGCDHGEGDEGILEEAVRNKYNACNDPKNGGEAVCFVPVFCAVKRPGKTNAYGIVLVILRHIVAEQDKDDTDKEIDEQPDINRESECVCVRRKTADHGNSRNDPKYQSEDFRADIFPFRIMQCHCNYK